MTIYTVAKDGSGTHTTIQAAANVAVAGDTVQVKAGTYNEQVIVMNSGVSGSPIKFISSGAIVSLPYTAVPQYSGLISVVGKSQILIEGFKTVGGFNGIKADKSSNVVIRNNTVENTYSDGIKVGFNSCTGIIVEGNTVSRNTDATTVWYAEMISISNAHNSEIRGNHVLQNTRGEAMVIKDASSFVKVYDNLVEKSKVGIYVGGNANGGTHDIEIYNNIAIDNTEGISSASESGGNVGSGAVRNLNFHDNFASRNGTGIMLSAWARPGFYTWYQNITFRNNRACANRWKDFLFDTPTAMRITGLVLDNNIAPAVCIVPTWPPTLPPPPPPISQVQFTVSAGAGGLIQMTKPLVSTPSAQYNIGISKGMGYIFKAIPNTDYQFEKWTDGQGQTSTSIEIAGVASVDMTYTASFVPVPPVPVPTPQFTLGKMFIGIGTILTIKEIFKK